MIQGLSNGGPGLGVSGRTGTGLPNGKGPFSLPSPFGSGPTGAGHGEGPGLNLPFPKPSQPMDFRSQPPPERILDFQKIFMVSKVGCIYPVAIVSLLPLANKINSDKMTIRKTHPSLSR